MELQECITNRRTVREFSKLAVPSDVIEKALLAGLKAPSYNHLRQWDFILVRDPQVRLALTQTEEMVEEVTEKLRKSFENHDSMAREMYLHAVPRQKSMILTAPEVLVVVYKPKTQIQAATQVSDLNGLASVWCCIENILLSLAEDNVFGVTHIPRNTKGVKEVLHVPQELEVPAIIPFGYRAPDAKIVPQKEVQLQRKLHVDKW